MILGSFTFLELPQGMTMIRPDRKAAVVETYSSVAFFSWGADIVGKIISLTWNAMSVAQFDALDQIYRADDEIIFNPTSYTGGGKTYRVQAINYRGEYWAGVPEYRLNCAMDLLIMSEVT